MTSPSPPDAAFADVEDEFDWEAAVREIDSACQGASSSISTRAPATASVADLSAHGPRHSRAEGSACGLRQSTLDRFVGGRGRRRDEGFGAQGFPDKVVLDVDDDPGGVRLDDDGIDLEAVKTWIYPVNVPRREYQFSIAERALFSNTLVALPTGLGKTLIAAVVMYNYFRWFPGGKIIFTAPSRPLVMQQIEACHKIVGISQEWTIDMTGQISPQKRSDFWKAKRVFFVTPQVLEKDIQSGICPVKQLVCLVIDEAHRALGNYSYCVAVRELMAVPVQLRVLALTATPGSKQQTIQNVIDNLHISTLEYRDENDCDVSRYVHNRKLELVEVAMSKDAIGINNLLLDAVQKIAVRLCAIGVLRRRDFSTLSPCELLNSRDNFRQAPPLDLPHVKYIEVEGYFRGLITLCHTRKLLSSHGIRPAYEMLEEKWKQGAFRGCKSSVESISNAKYLMQQSLSHGAPNPKLEKMKEVLVDHFKTQDPKDSRVIVFSNFRGSVRDIMNSLSEMGEDIKATEFIGQSSGKTLKGQSQKVQQAVLQKFRAGGYNIIVATSIGEEGLDIMEVDLVICFDANISPLRMIQRMGRTGRKHDGRVVVFACEGSELKGYLRKQSSSKAVRKHMHNGGTRSFDFHPSPRMVPHICKPQVQFVELSIEQFIARGKKVGEGSTRRSPFRTKISREEEDLLSRYFHYSKGDSWKPSLIAFPRFQAFASRVHKVRHSSKTTGMLIDAMQCLQGPSFSEANRGPSFEVNTSSDQTMGVMVVAHDDIYDKAFEKPVAFHHATCEALKGALQVDPDSDKSSKAVSDSREECHLPKPHFPGQKTSVLHRFLSGEEFVTVNSYGDISISSVPTFPSTKGTLHFKFVMAEGTYKSFNHNLPSPQELINLSGLRCTDSKQVLVSPSRNLDSNMQKLHVPNRILLKIPISGENLGFLKDSVAEVSADASKKRSASQTSKKRDTLNAMELSPRLTHLIEKGIVPESPMVKSNHYPPKSACSVGTCIITEHEKCGLLYSPADIHERISIIDKTSDSTMVLETPVKNNSLSPANDSPCTPKLLASPSSSGVSRHNKDEIKMEENSIHKMGKGKCNSSEPVIEDTPMVNHTKKSSSEDWKLSSAQVSKSVLQTPKYKRLRKHCDMAEKVPCKMLEESFCSSVKRLCQRTSRTNLKQGKHFSGKQKDKNDINCFIEEEAEVSSDAEVSEDEDDDKDEDAYDDSFIDDGRNSAEASNKAKRSWNDMMAFYRRSLLTQSPMAVGSPFGATSANESLSSRTGETGSCSSERINNSQQTPGNGFRSGNQSTDKNSVIYQRGSGKLNLLIASSEISESKEESKLESRKRKLSFQHVGSASATNLQPEHQIKSEFFGTKSACCQSDLNDMDAVIPSDDDFYKGLDLDAVEAHATSLIRSKSEISVKQKAPLDSSIEIEEDPDENLPAFPSFDLGIHFS